MTIRFDAAECRDLARALEREWLLVNGLGGYASGTLAGVNTRRYHGLLMAALRPPMQRVLCLAVVETWWVPAGGSVRALVGHEHPDGTVSPVAAPDKVVLDGRLPRWRWRFGNDVIERRLWMDPDQNRTVMTYRLLQGAAGRLRLRPLFALRHADQHRASVADAETTEVAGGWRVTIDGMSGVVATRPAGTRQTRGEWLGPFLHRVERARVLDAQEVLFAPGTVEVPLRAGGPVGLIAGVDDPPPDWSPASSLRRARQTEQGDLRAFQGNERTDPLARQLALAAGQFRVRRGSSREDGAASRTIIAGYPWFGDWGRDTMIALRGVALATGRHSEARAILGTFIAALDGGMLPNAFHDPGQPTEYNTIDATLWLFQALQHYLEASGDWPFVRAQIETLGEVIRWHVEGTRFGIRMDPQDGLLAGGAPGYGLTWMDARDGDWVVTPRRGKPVEIAALWYNALHLLASWRRRDGQTEAPYAAMAARAQASARRRFWYEEGGYLFDVIDSPDGDDASLRPNQLLALGLIAPLIEGPRARSALDVVTAKLLTPYGLRTLSPDDPRYQFRFGGDHRQRDGAYQMGIVWPWLLGPYLDAHRRLHGDPSITGRILAPFHAHLREAGVGTISEIFEAEPPYRPAGAIAQAWSVGELLWQARSLASSRAG